MSTEPTVLFIRESEQQTSSSGCCGRLEGDFVLQRGRPVFAERRAIMESMGPLYRAVRGRFGDRVSVQVVDPRNLPTMAFSLIRDFWRYRVGPAEAFATLARLPVTGLVINGRLVARGEWPDATEVIPLLEGLLEGGPLRVKPELVGSVLGRSRGR